MRCIICNEELTVSESCAKDTKGNYRDTCSKCSGVTYKTLAEYEMIAPVPKRVDEVEF